MRLRKSSKVSVCIAYCLIGQKAQKEFKSLCDRAKTMLEQLQNRMKSTDYEKWKEMPLHKQQVLLRDEYFLERAEVLMYDRNLTKLFRDDMLT